MNLHIILLCICEFRKNRRREGSAFLMSVSEIRLPEYHETSRQFESEDLFHEIFAVHDAVRLHSSIVHLKRVVA